MPTLSPRCHLPTITPPAISLPTISLPTMAMLAMLLTITACSTTQEIRDARQRIERGDVLGGIQRLQQLAIAHPQSAPAQSAWQLQRQSVLALLAERADRARDSGDTTAALKHYQDILTIDPYNNRADAGIREIERRSRHAEWLQQAKDALAAGRPQQASVWLHDILTEHPENAEARNLLLDIQSKAQREARLPPILKQSLTRPVSLEFRQVPLQSIFEVLSQSAGLNFILDPAMKAEEKATLFARNTTVEDSLNLLMTTHNFKIKPLNDSTLLVYPATGDKKKQYEEQVIKTFYISDGDPKTLSAMVRGFVKSAEVQVDEKLKTLVVRDAAENIAIVEKLLAANDIADAEVMLEIEIMEVNSDRLANLGIQYPAQGKLSVKTGSNAAGIIPVTAFSGLNRSNYTATLADPLAILNLKYTDGATNTLANPRIRVRNREKAKVLIGDKVPVITTTNNATSGTISENVNYLDVGIKLEVEPDVHINNDVGITINLEANDIVKEVTSTTGLVTYQIGTRTASTSLRLHDGETQALAGLIRRDDKKSASRIPGLGNIPILGRLFSNESSTRTRSELVLLITPRVVRSRALPAASDSEFLAGTENNPGTVLRLRNGSRYSNKASTSPLEKTVVDASTANQNSTDVNSANPSAAQPSAKDANPAMANPSPEQAGDDNSAADSDAPAVYFDPALAKVRLTLVSPSQIRVGQEFTLAIMANSYESFRELSAEILLPANMELVRTTAGGGLQLQGNIDKRLLTLSAHSVSPALLNGPLAMITLKPQEATTADPEPFITVRKLKASNAEQGDVPAHAGNPRALQVLP